MSSLAGLLPTIFVVPLALIPINASLRARNAASVSETNGVKIPAPT